MQQQYRRCMAQIVLGVDPGLVNMGISFWQREPGKRPRLLHCERVNLLKRKNGLTYEYQQKHVAQLVHLMIEDRARYFANVSLTVIEVGAHPKSNLNLNQHERERTAC